MRRWCRVNLIRSICRAFYGLLSSGSPDCCRREPQASERGSCAAWSEEERSSIRRGLISCCSQGSEQSFPISGWSSGRLPCQDRHCRRLALFSTSVRYVNLCFLLPATAVMFNAFWVRLCLCIAGFGNCRCYRHNAAVDFGVNIFFFFVFIAVQQIEFLSVWSSLSNGAKIVLDFWWQRRGNCLCDIVLQKNNSCLWSSLKWKHDRF